MTIEAELNALDITKSAIKQAIIGKGVPVSASDSFSTYPAKIEQIQTGSEPTLETLTVAPSTTAQTLTPPSGVDGFDEVEVNAVTAAIDSDIQAGNIKSGVEILGVTGTYTGEGVNLQSKTLTVDSTTPTVSTVAPDTGYDGLSSVTVDMTYVEDRLDTLLGTSVVPTGTLSITANGVYDVTNYASANVNVSGGGSKRNIYIRRNDGDFTGTDGMGFGISINNTTEYVNVPPSISTSNTLVGQYDVNDSVNIHWSPDGVYTDKYFKINVNNTTVGIVGYGGTSSINYTFNLTEDTYIEVEARTREKNITQNGSYSVSNYDSVNVDVSGISSITLSNFSIVEDTVGDTEIGGGIKIFLNENNEMITAVAMGDETSPMIEFMFNYLRSSYENENSYSLMFLTEDPEQYIVVEPA